MCEIQKKLVPELEQLAENTARPMRWPDAEALANEFSEAVLEEWQTFQINLYAALPEPQDFFQIRRDVMSGEKSFSLESTKKAFTPEELRTLGMRVQNAGLTKAQSEVLERVLEDFQNGLMIGGGEVQTTGAVFNKYYKDVFQEGLDKATDDAFQQIELESPRTQELFKANVTPIYHFTETSAFVKTIYKDGFKLIKDTVFNKHRGALLERLAEGLEAGIDWQSIARSMYRDPNLGMAASWQYRRLVRTEMTGVFDRASKERYQTMDVLYLKYSMVFDACPICQALNSQNGGWYLPHAAPPLPESTHPNCRCRYLPKWSKPPSIIPVGQAA